MAHHQLSVMGYIENQRWNSIRRWGGSVSFFHVRGGTSVMPIFVLPMFEPDLGFDFCISVNV